MRRKSSARPTGLVLRFQEPLFVDGRELLMGLSLGASIFPDHGREPEGTVARRGRRAVSCQGPGPQPRAACSARSCWRPRRRVSRPSRACAVRSIAASSSCTSSPRWTSRRCEAGVVESAAALAPAGRSYASPQDFLPVAEDCGLIREIGDWVIAVGGQARGAMAPGRMAGGPRGRQRFLAATARQAFRRTASGSSAPAPGAA